MNITNAFSYIRKDGQIIIFQAEHKIPEQGREKAGGTLLRSEGCEGAVFAPSDVSPPSCVPKLHPSLWNHRLLALEQALEVITSNILFHR